MGYSTRTDRGIRNVHSRTTRGGTSRAWDLLATLGGSEDLVWPSDRWPPMILDRGLRVGSRGGHGPIRYEVERVEEGRLVHFRLCTPSPVAGSHTVRIDGDGRSVRWTHTLDLVDPDAAARLVVLPLHDALIEDLFDQVGAAIEDRPLVRRTLGPRVRVLRRVLARAARRSRRDRMSAITVTAVGGLGATAALHAVWATGRPWPSRDEAAFARDVLGQPGRSSMPRPSESLAVAAALGTAAAATVVAARPNLDPVGRAGVDVVVGAAASVLALRAVAGPVAVALAPQRFTPQFARLDRRLYAPLCLALAAGMAHTIRAS